MIPPSALIDGFLEVWPYLLGAVGVAIAIGLAVPVKKKEHKDDAKVVVREEIKDDIKIVVKEKHRDVEVPYDVFLKMLSDYEKAKQEAQKSLLTQLALLEAKKDEERRKALRDLVKPEDAYKDLIKVKGVNGKKKETKEKEDEEVELDTSNIYVDQA